MTSEQAAQLIAQNDKLISIYQQATPLFNSLLHDVFPFLAVVAAAALGAVLGVAATR